MVNRFDAISIAKEESWAGTQRDDLSEIEAGSNENATEMPISSANESILTQHNECRREIAHPRIRQPLEADGDTLGAGRHRSMGCWQRALLLFRHKCTRECSDVLE